MLAHVWFNLAHGSFRGTGGRRRPDLGEQPPLTTDKPDEGESNIFGFLFWDATTLVAASYTFFFSFTSFALVKWLAPTSNTLNPCWAKWGYP